MLEPAIEELTRALGEDVEQIALGRQVKVGERPALPGRRDQRGKATTDIGRHLQRQVAQHIGDLLEGGIVSRIGFRVFLGKARKFGLGPPRATAQLQIVVGEREEVADRPLDHAVAVIVQLHVRDHLGAQQADGVAGGGIAEAGVEFLGHRRAADHMAAFQHPHTHPRAGKVEGAGQAVVATADDQGVVMLGHGLFPWDGRVMVWRQPCRLQPGAGAKGWRASGTSARIFLAKLRRQTSLRAIGPVP